MISTQQSIEVFHLIFLKVLKGHLDSNLYTLKGGCNLRFFFESIRYSEDIDLDISVISEITLKKKIDTILEQKPLRQALRVYGLEIEQVSSPKQTHTVQRWKVGIKHKDRNLVIPTKIEFSRRNMESDRLAEPINALLLQNYKLPPMILPHYRLTAAINQKISALLHRSQTQARDVFDLHMLFCKLTQETGLIEFDVEQAISNILSISFNDFHSQVVNYLLAEYIDYYSSQSIWEKLQLELINHLNKIKAS